MKYSYLIIVFLLLQIVFIFPVSIEIYAFNSLESLNLQQEISNYFQTEKDVEHIFLQTQFYSYELLSDFYQQRDFKSAWINRYGLNSLGEELISMINNAEKQGLIPEDYHLSLINKLWLLTYNLSSSNSWYFTHNDGEGPITYKVRSGDTLWGLSRSWDVAISEIQELNNLENATSLQINQKLKIPTYVSEKLINRNITRNQALIKLELFLTDAFFVYISDIYAGRINPHSNQREWIKKRSEIDYISILNKVLYDSDLKEVIQNSNPQSPKFKGLLKILNQYQEVNKNFKNKDAEEISFIEKLKEHLPFIPGDINIKIKEIRNRLQLEPGISINLKGNNTYYFDEDLAETLKIIQQRYNLNPTGKIDYQTLEKLNEPLDNLIKKIKINIERWRWLPRDLGDDYVLVNLPDFTMKVFEDNNLEMKMKTVIGKDARQTPVFSDRITHLVFNPRWYVPRSIAVEDHLPQVKEDISFFEEQNMRVYQRTADGFKEINPENVDWQEITKDNFDYYFWQDAGPWNALGRVVFRSPATNNIYLHDTPAKYLFNKEVRSFSSGCVRLEDAFKFAEYLLQENKEWDKDRINSFTRDGYEKTVFLSDPINLHLVYWTVWVDENGQFQSRNDIYERDLELINVFFNS